VSPNSPLLSEEDTRRLLVELEPVAAGEVERHLAAAKEWFPHEYIPWSLGRTYDGLLEGEAWQPGDSEIPDVVRTALIVNLLTEDNLPSYHFEIAQSFGREGAWGTWVHRWTAEEDRHAIAIRDYLSVTRAVDPVELERARMVHMSAGYQNDYDTMLHSLAYVSFQELATRISHRNTGAASDEPICQQLLTRVAADENLHMIFYRNMLGAAFQLEPSLTMRAVRDVVLDFKMPGHSIEGFTRKSVQIANAGIYDLRQHKDQVLVPVLRQWQVWDIEGLDAEAEKARTELSEYLEGVELAAQRLDERRAAQQARAAARG
jgi:acyl-[acyl-carrier-protein] desaturase